MVITTFTNALLLEAMGATYMRDRSKIGSNNRLAFAVLLSVIVFSDPAAAQLRDRLTEDSLRRRHEIYRSWSYLKEKDSIAREKGSSWLMMGGWGGGYDSNIFESFENEKSSALIDGMFRVENWRYLSERDQLRIRVDVPLRIHLQETPEGNAFRGPDQFEPRVMAEWRRQQSENLRFGIWTEFKYENDGIVNTEGFSSVRDFEHIQATVRPWLEYRFGGHRATFQVQSRYRDYVPTEGLPSLDFWRFGPNLDVEFRTSESTSVSVGYQFRVEDYIAAPSRNRDGRFGVVRPPEKHNFHRASLEGTWRPNRKMLNSLAVAYIRKDDLFEDFESFHDYLVWGRTELYVTDRVKFSLMAAYEFRDYDRRPSGGGDRLEHSRYYLLPALRYEIDGQFAVYGYYMFNSRDSNRIFGRDFRDFEINRFITGVSFAF